MMTVFKKWFSDPSGNRLLIEVIHTDAYHVYLDGELQATVHDTHAWILRVANLIRSHGLTDIKSA